MSKRTLSTYWPLLLLGIVVAMVVGAFFLMPRHPVLPGGVTIIMDSNGTTRLGRVPLLTTNIRDATFATMGNLGIKASLAIPVPPTNQAQESNLLETLNSMTRAGLFMTNKPSSSAYE